MRLLKCVQPLSVIAVWFVSRLPWINSGMMQFVHCCDNLLKGLCNGDTQFFLCPNCTQATRYLIANYYGDNSILLEYIQSFH